MVYVINKQGQALMPTERFGKVRRLLKNSLSHVVCRIPFTIQLDYDTTDYTQPVSLGVDAGSKHIGISATTSEKELYAAEKFTAEPRHVPMGDTVTSEILGVGSL